MSSRMIEAVSRWESMVSCQFSPAVSRRRCHTIMSPCCTQRRQMDLQFEHQDSSFWCRRAEIPMGVDHP